MIMQQQQQYFRQRKRKADFNWNRTVTGLFHLDDIQPWIDGLPTIGKITRDEQAFHTLIWFQNETILDLEFGQAFLALYADGPEWKFLRHPYFLAVAKRVANYVTAQENADNPHDPREDLNIFEWCVFVAWEKANEEQLRQLLREQAREEEAAKCRIAELQVRKAARKAAVVAARQRAAELPVTPISFSQHTTPTRPVALSAVAAAPARPERTARRTGVDGEGDDDDDTELTPDRSSSTAQNQSLPTVTGQVLSDMALKKSLPGQWSDKDGTSRPAVKKYIQSVEKGTARMSATSTADMLNFFGPLLCKVIERAAEHAGRGMTAHKAWKDAGKEGNDPYWRTLPPVTMFRLLNVLFEDDADKRGARSMGELFAKIVLKIDINDPDAIQQGLNLVEQLSDTYEPTQHLSNGEGWLDPLQILGLLKRLGWNLLQGRKGDPGIVNTQPVSGGTREQNLRLELWRRIEEKLPRMESIEDWTQAVYNVLKEISEDATRLVQLGILKGSADTQYAMRDGADADKLPWCKGCGVSHLIGVHPLTEKEREQRRAQRQSSANSNFTKSERKRILQILASDGKDNNDANQPSMKMRAIEKGGQPQRPQQSGKKNRGSNKRQFHDGGHYGPGGGDKDKHQKGGRRSRK
jgi:hypothetical protein